MPDAELIKRILVQVAGIDGIDPVALQESLQINHLHNKLNELIDMHHSEKGLTPRQTEILQVLFHCDDEIVTPADLAERVGLTRSAMTSALDSLEKDNRIIRKPHPSDRRMLVICITEQTREFMAKVLVDKYRRMCRVTLKMTETERKELLRVYKKLITLIEDDFQEFEL